MEPKEKAKELIRKFYSIGAMECKKCALIAIDAVIEQNNLWIEQTKRGTNNYWQEVKQEIEKL